MQPYNILHITNWYPSKETPLTAPFIKEHYKALSAHTNGHIIHLDICNSPKFFFKLKKTIISDSEESYIIHSKITQWFLKEILSLLLLIRVLIEKKYKNYDMLIFHIGYPILTYFHWIKRIVNKPILIIEHWSAFYHNFNLPKKTTKLNKIKNIFRQQYPLVTVSKSLKKDIENFSNSKQNAYILPNIADHSIFNFNKKVKKKHNQFFMLSNWYKKKSPLPVLYAFEKYILRHKNAVLRIGGHGAFKIEEFIHNRNLASNIILLGSLDKYTVAKEMQESSAFLHCSEYETFSIVCAEAICCGCPVIVSNLDAVKEFINSSNGIIVESPSEWLEALYNFRLHNYNSEKMSSIALSKFDTKVVGVKFYELINNVYTSYYAK